MEAAVETSPRLRAPALVALASVYLVWGSTYWVMHVAFASLPPFVGSGTRYIIAGTVLTLFLRVRGAPSPTAAQWLRALPVGMAMFLVGNGTVALTGRYIPSGVVAVVCATAPLWAAALGRLWGEKTRARDMVALGIGIGGVVVFASASELRANPLMTALLFGAPVGWAFGSVLARRLALAPGLMSAATQMLSGGLAVLSFGLLRGERWPVHIETSALFAFLYLVVFGSLIAFSAYTYLLRTVKPALAMSYAYVNPVLAMFLGSVLGGEAVRPQSIVATLLIVTAVMLAVKK